MKNTLLEVNNVSISFTQYAKGLDTITITPVRSLNITIKKGEILAIVGASGSGKSLLAHAIMGILPVNASVEGEIYYNGDLLDQQRIERLRGKEIAFIPQSVNYLDPLMKVGKQVQIGLGRKNVDGNKIKTDKKKAIQMQKQLFERYGLKENVGDLLPYELSGGMLRRVLFATSVRDEVNLVIADEPTPGLHPQALEEILKQIADFSKKGAGVMFITHDIISALTIADRVAVLKDGKIVEIADAKAFVGKGEQLKNPYTKRLWNALPQNDFVFE